MRSMSVISRHDSTTERKLSRMQSLQRTISGTSQPDVSVLCNKIPQLTYHEIKKIVVVGLCIVDLRKNTKY